MTEAEWLTANDPTPILGYFRDKASGRKLRLAGCGCCHRILPFLDDTCLSSLVDTVERLVDEEADPSEVESILASIQKKFGLLQSNYLLFSGNAGVAFATAHPTNYTLFENAYLWLASTAAWGCVPGAVVESGDWEMPRDPVWQAAWTNERKRQVLVFQDIFRNPFRAMSADPSWLTSDVVALARGIYEDRAFYRMPILADALQDAGCEDDMVLNHCRQSGEHVRGCWVVDLVLGKE